MRVHPMFRKLNRLERQNLIEEAMRQVSVELREYMKAEAFDIIEGHENTFNFMIPIEVTVGYEAERTDLMDP